MENTWAAVDNYFGQQLISEDPIFSKILKINSEAGLPPHDVSSNQGKLLQIFVQMIGAKSILEVGTLGAYSTIWMAKALPQDGRVLSLEFNSKHADVAKNNVLLAGLREKIEIRLGDAMDLLPRVKEEGQIFDLIFIDADKKSNSAYFKWALALSRSGTVIIVDNVVRNGAVIDAGSDDPSVIGVRKLNELIKNESKVQSTVVQTVGTKGYDGFIIARVQ